MAAAAARATTRSARPATRATPRSPRHCDPPIPRCCTTVPAVSFLASARQVPRLRPGPRRSARPRCRDPPNRSRADGTRCSADATSRSSRRPRPSPRTYRARWGSRSQRCAARALHCGGWPADAITVCSFGDASATLDGRGCDQHRAAYRLSGRADTDPVRLRGQRSGH